MAEQLIAPTFLFRFRVPCQKVDKKWSKKDGLQLPADFTVPSFQAELSGAKQFADVSVGWNEDGIVFNVHVKGKKQAAWCRESRLEESDGFTIWIDTRDTHNVHRAGRFCHQFIFLPFGEGAKQQNPVAELLNINRAKDNPKQPNRGTLLAKSQKHDDGYSLQGFIPGSALTGWDPADHSKLGFYYVVMDRELGWQTLSLGSEYPFQSDPSLWGTLELKD